MGNRTIYLAQLPKICDVVYNLKQDSETSLKRYLKHIVQKGLD